MSIFSNLFGNRNRPLRVEGDKGGNWFTTIFSSKTNYNKYSSATDKINAYQSNPALHKAISIISGVGKLANINLYENDKLKQKNYLYQVKAKPNPYQTWTDFTEEYLVYSSLGTAYYFKDQGLKEENRNSYWLNPDCFDSQTLRIFDKLGKKPTMSSKNEALKDYGNHIIKYTYNGQNTVDIPLKLVTPIHSDVCFDSWYSGGSVIDSLSKIITNSESTLDAKNINLHFIQKFLLFSKTPTTDHQNAITGFTDSTEKDQLKAKMYSNENVLVSSAENIELKRFVERLKELGLDESFHNDYMVICLGFGIPLDIADSWLKGKGLTSQGESQEKSMIRFIEMVIMPKLQKYTDVLELVEDKNQEVKAEFTHLGFMRVVEVEKSNKQKLDLENLKVAFDLGMDESEIKRQLKLIYNGN